MHCPLYICALIYQPLSSLVLLLPRKQTLLPLVAAAHALSAYQRLETPTRFLLLKSGTSTHIHSALQYACYLVFLASALAGHISGQKASL